LARRQWFVTNAALLPAAVGGLAPAGVRIRRGTRDDVAALTPLVFGRESLVWRFARNDVVLVAEIDGRVVGCTWLTSRSLRPSYLPTRVSPRPGQWYNYGLVILTEARGKGIGRALSRAAMVEVRRLGGKLIYGHADAFNRIAAASHAAAGFVTIEELFGINLLDRYLVLLRRRRLVQPSPLDV
jgi:GNAT superfamily N-acetyltransferase